MKERLDFGALRLPQPLEDRRWIGHRAGQDLSHRLVGGVIGKCRTAIGDELVHLKHRDLPSHRAKRKLILKGYRCWKIRQWVIRDSSRRSHTTAHVRFAPKATVR